MRLTANGVKVRKHTTAAVVVIAVVVVLVAGVGSLMWVTAPRPTSPTSEKPALVINGQNVPTRELAQFVAAERANTIGYFQEHYGAQVDAEFWSSRHGGTTPRAHLINAAITDAARFTVQEQEAEKLKVLVGFSYENLLVKWVAENRGRANDLAAGRVIYGPRQYTEAGYFQSVSNSISSTLENKLITTGTIKVSQSTMRQYYDTHMTDYPKPLSVQAAPGPELSAAAEPFVQVESQVRQSCSDLVFHSWVAHKLAIAHVVRVSEILDSLVVS